MAWAAQGLWEARRELGGIGGWRKTRSPIIPRICSLKCVWRAGAEVGRFVGRRGAAGRWGGWEVNERRESDASRAACDLQ